MTQGDFLKIAEEAILLEQNISKLYFIFHHAYPEEAEFWWTMIQEENNHAALIKSGVDYFMPADKFPTELLEIKIQDLQEVNSHLQSLLKQYEKSPPTKTEAFQIALKTEMSVGELHFQKTISGQTDSQMMKLFQRLNQNDKDHAKRIRAYMEENGIGEDVYNS